MVHLQTWIFGGEPVKVEEKFDEVPLGNKGKPPIEMPPSLAKNRMMGMGMVWDTQENNAIANAVAHAQSPLPPYPYVLPSNMVPFPPSPLPPSVTPTSTK